MLDKMSRRNSLKLMIAGSGGFIVASTIEAGGISPTSIGPEPCEGVLGRIVESNGALLVEDRDGRQISISTRRDTQMINGAFGATDRLSDFIVGDTVVATGVFNSPTELAADFVGSLFEQLELQIDSIGTATRDGGQEAPVASGVLPDATRSRVPVDALRVGRQGTALTWTHPTDGTVYLLDFQ